MGQQGMVAEDFFLFSFGGLFQMIHAFLDIFQVKILTQNENGKLQAALASNLKSAVTAAFLMLPESFSEEDLYMQIAGLSYSGQYGFPFILLVLKN